MLIINFLVDNMSKYVQAYKDGVQGNPLEEPKTMQQAVSYYQPQVQQVPVQTQQAQQVPVQQESQEPVSKSEVEKTALMTGGKVLPDNIQTLGDVVNNKSDLLKYNNKGTATGLYQITSDTFKEFGPKVFGDEWQNQNVRDPNVQYKIAEAIWNQNKDSASRLAGRWDSIKNDAKDFVGKTWDEVQQIIANRESGGSYAPTRVQAQQVPTQVAQVQPNGAQQVPTQVAQVQPQPVASKPKKDESLSDKATRFAGAFKGLKIPEEKAQEWINFQTPRTKSQAYKAPSKKTRALANNPFLLNKFLGNV